jgi:hypothetical protein
MRHHFLDTSFGLMTFLLRIPKFRLLRIGHPSPTFEVCAFVSLCSYYHKYIWRFAEIAAPLTNLLKDGGWCPPSDPDVLTVVDKLKEALISSPVLAYFKQF